MARPEEAMTLDLLIELILKEKTGVGYLAEIVLKYQQAGAKDVVDLSGVLGPGGFGVGGGGQAPLNGACEGCPSAGDRRFKRGNANCVDLIDIADAQYILAFLFTGGSAPIRFDAADCDDNGILQITDAVYLLAFLFQGGPKPPKPFEYLGLDPTLDGQETSCDLVASRYKEFNCYQGDRDVDGIEGADALYIFENLLINPPSILDEDLPTYDLRLERPTDVPGQPAAVFHRFMQPIVGSAPVPKLLAVGEDRVVYVLMTSRTIWALKDWDMDGIADDVRSFVLPTSLQFPIDATLADSDDGECLITLHRGNLSPLERLVVSIDSDQDGFIDVGDQQIIPVGVPGLPRISTPKALGVDACTARVFVCGTLSTDPTKTAVIFYEDTEGDKLVNTPGAQAYVTSPTTANRYDSIVFVPEIRALLTLSHPPVGAGGGAKVLCDRDPGDFYVAPTPPQTTFKTGLTAAAFFVDAYRLANGTLHSQLTYSGFKVCEHDDTNQDCVADQDLGCFDKADAALFETGDSICRMQIFDGFDYAILPVGGCVNWSTCSVNGSEQFLRYLHAEVTYPCVAFPVTSDAVAGWLGPTPAITGRADWATPPIPPRNAVLWVEGETYWSFRKLGACCFYHCEVRSTFTIKTDIYFDGVDPNFCPSPLLAAK